MNHLLFICKLLSKKEGICKEKIHPEERVNRRLHFVTFPGKLVKGCK